MIFISRFFDFRIIREVLNSRANIRVVGHFRGLKLGMQTVVSQRSKVVVHRIAIHFSVPTYNCHSNVIVYLNTRSKSLVHIRIIDQVLLL